MIFLAFFDAQVYLNSHFQERHCHSLFRLIGPANVSFGLDENSANYIELLFRNFSASDQAKK